MVVSGRTTDENNTIITATQSEERVQNNTGGQGRKQQGVKTINLRKVASNAIGQGSSNNIAGPNVNTRGATSSAGR